MSLTVEASLRTTQLIATQKDEFGKNMHRSKTVEYGVRNFEEFYKRSRDTLVKNGMLVYAIGGGSGEGKTKMKNAFDAKIHSSTKVNKWLDQSGRGKVHEFDLTWIDGINLGRELGFIPKNLPLSQLTSEHTQGVTMLLQSIAKRLIDKYTAIDAGTLKDRYAVKVKGKFSGSGPALKIGIEAPLITRKVDRGASAVKKLAEEYPVHGALIAADGKLIEENLAFRSRLPGATPETIVSLLNQKNIDPDIEVRKNRIAASIAKNQLPEDEGERDELLLKKAEREIYEEWTDVGATPEAAKRVAGIVNEDLMQMYLAGELVFPDTYGNLNEVPPFRITSSEDFNIDPDLRARILEHNLFPRILKDDLSIPSKQAFISINPTLPTIKEYRRKDRSLPRRLKTFRETRRRLGLAVPIVKK